MAAIRIYKRLQMSVAGLSILGLSWGAIAPVGAVDAPNSSPSGGAPDRTASGSSQRSEVCVITRGDLDGDGRIQAHENLTPMTVLSPVGNQISTLDPNPTLFVYLPQTLADSAELFVSEQIPSANAQQGDRYQDIYDAVLPVPDSSRQGPRIVTYELKDVNLESGKTYAWALSLFCDEASPREGQVEGLITCDQGCVVSADIPDPQSLTTRQLAQRAAKYTTANFWNEAMRFTAPLRNRDQQQWQTLLESQGLGCFKDVPFADEVNVDYTIDDDPQCFVDQDDDVFVENPEGAQNLNDLLLQ